MCWRGCSLFVLLGGEKNKRLRIPKFVLIHYYYLSKINKCATIFHVKLKSWEQDACQLNVGWTDCSRIPTLLPVGLLRSDALMSTAGAKKKTQQLINMKTGCQCQTDGSKHRESQLFNWMSRRESFDWRAILHDALSVASKQRQDVDSPHVWERHGAVNPQWRRCFCGISPGFLIKGLLWLKKIK